MITKNQIKYYASLQKKKSREEEGVFLIEGHRSVLELFQSRLELKAVIATDAWLSQNEHLLPKSTDCIIAPQVDLERISSLQTPPQVIACAALPRMGQLPIPSGRLILALDTVQDPGNMGTILRLADWFGISQLICSPDTVDCFNSKVVQASMGAIFRVRVYYLDLTTYLKHVNQPIFGALLEGKPYRTVEYPENAILIMGNEGKGIRPENIPLIQTAVTIPKFGEAESLNVAAATAILLAEMVK